MIANPSIPAYRYDPYSRKLSREVYDQRGMREARRRAVETASTAKRFGVILGTLGRQGNPAVLKHIESRLQSLRLEYTVFLMSELVQSKLDAIDSFDAWIQICCPRLSIDWGEKFKRPLLSSYEAEVCLGFAEPWWDRGSRQRTMDLDGSSDCSGAHELGTESIGAGDCGEECPDASGQISCCGGSGSDGAGACGSGSCTGNEEYPMDYYSKDGGAWCSSWHKAP